MKKHEFVIKFSELCFSQAGQKAMILLETLRSVSPDIQVRIVKNDSETMDLGSTLVLLFGTPAIIALAKGIAGFLARERPGTLLIKTKDEEVVFSGASSDAATIAAAFTRAINQHKQH